MGSWLGGGSSGGVELVEDGPGGASGRGGCRATAGSGEGPDSRMGCYALLVDHEQSRYDFRLCPNRLNPTPTTHLASCSKA